MARNPLWDTEKLCSHAPRVGAGEPGAAATTRRVEGAPATASADGDGRIFWVLLSRLWTSWRDSVHVVRPETVVGWHRHGFRCYWAWKSRHRRGRPRLGTELRDLIRRMSRANPLWGAPRIHGELLKLGLTVSQATVSKYMVWPRRPPSQAWRTFLKNHAPDLIALDFFTVSTATFRVLFVLVILTHSRRRLVHLNVTEHPTAEWTARQLLEACALEEGPRYLIRDRDQVYGERFSRQAKTLDIPETVIAPRSPWQNAYAERVIGSIRPWWTPQNRPYVDGAKAAIGADAQASEL